MIFCSWGAEEYGLIVSYEWAEENAKVLSQRAVAYLNVDIAVEGFAQLIFQIYFKFILLIILLN